MPNVTFMQTSIVVMYYNYLDKTSWSCLKQICIVSKYRMQRVVAALQIFGDKELEFYRDSIRFVVVCTMTGFRNELHLPYVSIRQHPSAYISIRKHTSAYGLKNELDLYLVS